MSFVNRLQEAWKVLLSPEGQVAPPATKGVADASQLGALQREWNEAFQISSDRSGRLADFARMDTGLISIILDDLVNSALTFDGSTSVTDDPLNINNAFKIQCDGYGTSGPKQVLRQVIEDTQLRQLCRFALRDTARNGDDFWEPLTDGDSNLVRLFPHHAADITVKRDKKGGLEIGTDTNGIPLAYRQRTDAGALVAGWFPWEFFHIKYWNNPKFTYSERSYLDPYRNIWRQLDWIEQSMVIARVTRSFPRNCFKVDLTGKSPEEAKKLMRNFANAVTRRETPSGMQSRSPMTPDEDYFLSTGYRTGSDSKMYPSLNSLELLDPKNEGLSNIQDITYLQSQLFSQVPGEMLGIHQQRPQDVTSQEIAMNSLVGYLQRDVLEAQFVRPVLDLGLWLKGYREKVSYRVIWPSIGGYQSWKLADAQFRLALAYKVELDSKTTSRLEYLKRKYGYSSDEAEAILKQYEDEEKRFGPTNPKDVSGQMATGNTSASVDPRDDSISEAERLTRLVNS